MVSLEFFFDMLRLPHTVISNSEKIDPPYCAVKRILIYNFYVLIFVFYFVRGNVGPTYEDDENTAQAGQIQLSRIGGTISLTERTSYQ